MRRAPGPSTPGITICQLLFALIIAVVLGESVGLVTDGNISLLIAVPLTKDNVSLPDPGWIQLAAALMAMDHFNDRNASVIPTLASLTENCHIQFDMESVSVLDTGTTNHLELEQLKEQHIVGFDGTGASPMKSPPHAIAGPYHEVPALELSVLATLLRIPIVAHRAVDYNLLLPDRHPYFSQVGADLFNEMVFVSNYLEYAGREDYVAVVYSSAPAAMQKVDALRILLDQYNNMTQVRTFSYHPSSSNLEGLPEITIQYALERVKESGFRTIVWLSDDIAADTPEIDAAASALGLDLGEHLWVFSGGTSKLTSREQERLLQDSLTNSSLNNFLTGAVFLTPFDNIAAKEPNAFELVLPSQNRSFLERLERLTPIPNYTSWWSKDDLNDANVTLNDVMLRLQSWWTGCAYMYDAVMAIGIGACKAQMAMQKAAADNKDVPLPLNISGDLHLAGIRASDFQGATGQIVFQGGDLGSRVGSTVPFAVVNLLPPGAHGYPGVNGTLLQVTETRDPVTGEFVTTGFPFVYANGSYYPPHLLRDTPEQNYLDPGIRAFGLSLMVIALMVVFLCMVWVIVHRQHSVVIAAQPAFLYALCVGSAVLALNIWMNSFDEYHAWNDTMLDDTCLASAWMSVLGIMIIYGALFIKHWRVNRLMLHKERYIPMRRMLWPCLLLAAVVIGLLSYWTSTGSYGWERSEVDEVTGESVGSCMHRRDESCIFL